MKKIFLFIFILPIFCFSQSSPVSQITYYDVNDITGKIQGFIESNLFMVKYGESIFTKESITEKYITQTTMGNVKPEHLKIVYSIIPDSPRFVIKKCLIIGSYNAIIDFFVRYWPTNINIEEAKRGVVAVSYYWQDKITLKLDPANRDGIISIINTTVTGNKIPLSNQTPIQPEKIKSKKDTSYYEFGQTEFVNTNNLILRSSPENYYVPHLILHAPAKIKELEPDDDAFKNNPEIHKKYAYVKFSYQENYSGLTGFKTGWVMRKYLVRSLSDIKKYDTLPPYDAKGNIHVSNFQDCNRYEETKYTNYLGDFKSDPNKNLWKKYPYPKYKGGNEITKSK